MTVRGGRETEGVPRDAEAGTRHVWTVAGGLVERGDRLLLVRNVRRGGYEDWSPPGGVIDGGESILDGLTREVAEETGLRVQRWSGPLYEVHADAPDMGWTMRCEVHRAVDFVGELTVDDPDGIVAEAVFVAPVERDEALSGCARWVREPLQAWLERRWDASTARVFRYIVHGSSRDDLRVERAES